MKLREAREEITRLQGVVEQEERAMAIAFISDLEVFEAAHRRRQDAAQAVLNLRARVAWTEVRTKVLAPDGLTSDLIDIQLGLVDVRHQVDIDVALAKAMRRKKVPDGCRAWLVAHAPRLGERLRQLKSILAQALRETELPP